MNIEAYKPGEPFDFQENCQDLSNLNNAIQLKKSRFKPTLKLITEFNDLPKPKSQASINLQTYDLLDYEISQLFSYWVSNAQKITTKFDDYYYYDEKEEIFEVCMKKCNRTEQQDRFIAETEKSGKRIIKFYGVFDGHGGQFVANFVSQSIFKYILKHIKLQLNIQEAIKSAFEQLDKELLNFQILKSQIGGTTALCCLIIDKKIFLINLGDSIAVKLKSNNKIQQITIEHTLTNSSEMKKVQQRGGVLIENKNKLKIEGELTFTRALGNANYKPALSCEPDIYEINLDQETEFIILATDGF